MADPALTNQLRIKTGSLKRLHKEYLSYIKETETLQTKFDEFKATNPDDYSLKKRVMTTFLNFL